MPSILDGVSIGTINIYTYILFIVNIIMYLTNIYRFKKIYLVLTPTTECGNILYLNHKYQCIRNIKISKLILNVKYFMPRHVLCNH